MATHVKLPARISICIHFGIIGIAELGKFIICGTEMLPFWYELQK
jgi:hypothetical protein